VQDHRTPFLSAGEKETLRAFLDYLREAIVRKVSGLDADVARQPQVPSGTSLLGLAKHLTKAEVFWFPYITAGHEVAVPGDAVEDGDEVDGVLERYRAACTESNRVIAEADPEQRTARSYDSRDLTVRWVHVHMVEETARHAGHADILREQLDGRTGR